jgi:prepilin-type processing-associated H-X9-DG protein
MYTAPPTQNVPKQAKPNVIVWILIAVIGGCGCGFCLLAAVLFPVFRQARVAAIREGCIYNVKQLSAGMLMYAADHDDGLPPAGAWMDDIARYTRGRQDVFTCPSVRRESPGSCGYAMNLAVSVALRGAIASGSTTPLVFDSTILSRNAADGPDSMPSPGRHGGKNTVGYVDGHVAAVQGR